MLQLSVAVAIPVVAGSVLDVHCIVTLAGQVITGGVLSSTVMVWVHVLEFPHASVALHNLLMTYSDGHAPGRDISV